MAFSSASTRSSSSVKNAELVVERPVDHEPDDGDVEGEQPPVRQRLVVFLDAVEDVLAQDAVRRSVGLAAGGDAWMGFTHVVWSGFGIVLVERQVGQVHRPVFAHEQGADEGDDEHGEGDGEGDIWRPDRARNRG